MLGMNDAERQILTLPPYNLRWPTFVSENDVDRESWRRSNAITLGYLQRKFYEGLRSGRKIYVLKQRQPVPLAEAAVLFMELNWFANATLLSVRKAPHKRSAR